MDQHDPHTQYTFVENFGGTRPLKPLNGERAGSELETSRHAGRAQQATWAQTFVRAFERVIQTTPGIRLDVDDPLETYRTGELSDLKMTALALAIEQVEREDAALIDRKPRTDIEWAQLLATPLRWRHRQQVLLRLGGHWLRSKFGEFEVLAMLLVHNRSMCLPPLHPIEVETLWRWLVGRRHEQAMP